MGDRPVQLFHSTDDDGKRGIEANGFGKSNVNDLPPGHSSFASTAEGTIAASCQGWFVIVDIPADDAEPYRYRYDDGWSDPSLFVIPWEVVNRYRPFRYERPSGLSPSPDQ